MSKRPTRRPPQPPPTGSTLAAELALGVLDPSERAAAEARAAGDAKFAAEAAAWSARLHPITEVVAPLEPSPAVWSRIEAGLPAGNAKPARPARSAARPSAANDRADSDLSGGELAPKSLLRRWRILAAGMAVVAAACLAALAVTVGRQASDTPLLPTPLLSARLTPPADTPVLMASEALYTATVDRAHGSAVLTPVNPGPRDPRERELWVIPNGGKPISLGLIDKARTVPVRLAPALVKEVRGGATLAVTLEPKGGAPGGVPTGPVIASGVLARI